MDLNRRNLLLALLSLGAFSIAAPVWARDDRDDDDDDRDDDRDDDDDDDDDRDDDDDDRDDDDDDRDDDDDDRRSRRRFF